MTAVGGAPEGNQNARKEEGHVTGHGRVTLDLGDDLKAKGKKRAKKEGLSFVAWMRKTLKEKLAN